MLNFDEMNEETREILKKAMDIYSVIQFRGIWKYVRKLNGNYAFTGVDKKVLALFTACLMASDRIGDVVSEYGDIKVSDLLDFMEIKQEEIVSLSDGAYAKMYNDAFFSDVFSLINEEKKYYEVNRFTPETLYASFGGTSVSVNGSDILDYYAGNYDVSTYFFHDHPSFEKIKNIALMQGDIEKKIVSRGNDLGGIAFILGGLDSSFRDFDEREKERPDRGRTPIDGDDKKEEVTVDLDSDEIWNILDDIQEKFIGQEEACAHLFYNIINNQQLAKRDDVADGERSIVFIDGPTGTGKTAITREITEKLGIPFVSSSATNYSGTGYVGGDITDVLKTLIKKANGDIEKAQRGIVVFDEFDKIAYGRMGGLEMKRAVQQQLLDFLGGGKYKVSMKFGIFGSAEVDFDTSKLTFVCLGALTETRDNKIAGKKAIGFGHEKDQEEQKEYSITPQDLMDIGLERELVGRFNTYLHTNEYSKEDLLRILKNSTISPMLGFKKWVESKNKKLVIAQGVEEAIVDAAYELNTGARSLQTIMNNIRTPLIKEVLRGKEECVELTVEMVRSITSNIKTRKVLRKAK